MEISARMPYGGVKTNKEDTTVKQNKERPGVMIYFHIFEMLKLMEPQQVGEIMLALMAYARDGVEPDFNEQVMQIVWVNMKNASDTDLVHYEEKRAQAKAASAKRWGKDADASDRIRTVPINNNNTETETSTETDTDTKADADAITQASASAETTTKKETTAAEPQRREMPPLETPPAMANSPSYRRMVEASKHRPTPEEHEQRKAALIQQLLQHPA